VVVEKSLFIFREVHNMYNYQIRREYNTKNNESESIIIILLIVFTIILFLILNFVIAAPRNFKIITNARFGNFYSQINRSH